MHRILCTQGNFNVTVYQCRFCILIQKSTANNNKINEDEKNKLINLLIKQARHVSWTFMGHEISTNNNPDYSIVEEPLPEGIKSVLIIRESQSKHFGPYNCTVVNEHGNDILEIELLRQG